MTKTTWFTTALNSFGTVKVVISGSTNADKLTVETYGDGIIGVKDVILDSKKNFANDTTEISFTHFASSGVPNGLFQSTTKIRAIKGTDTLVQTVKSGLLSY